MVDPFEILPILAMALIIVCIPLLSDGPPTLGRRRVRGEPDQAEIDEDHRSRGSRQQLAKTSAATDQ
jgi:hypothetical protein